MDVVLEILDTLVFDRIYATVLPASSRPSVYDATKGAANATASSTRQPVGAVNNYQYHPSTKYMYIEPPKWAYMSSWQRDDPLRQLASLYLITWVFGLIVYFIFASASYYFVFDHNSKKHPKYLKNQISLEIKQTLISLPLMAIFTAPIFWLEVQGYGKLYDTTADGPGLWYNIVQIPFFIMFTDCFIYFIHRGLHHPLLYKTLHKPHHKWIMPTPFASHAFHPVDGFAQSIPYHVFPFLFPLQKGAYVCLFVFINIWTILIHDGEYMTNHPVINGAACHTTHHLAFNWNYGQFTTLWDRLGGSYRAPDMAFFNKHTKMAEETWNKQKEEMESVVMEVEGEDDRTYLPDEKKVQ